MSYQPAGPPPGLPSPAQLGGYGAVREIGRGGTGIVFLAQGYGGTWVAVKWLRGMGPQGPVDPRLVRSNVQMLTSITHPHLVRVLDVQIAGPDLCVVMEYVHGVNLRQLLAQRSATPQEVMTWVGSLAVALNYLHGMGIVHHDVKPSNVLLDPDRGAKLTDFTVAPPNSEGQHPAGLPPIPGGTPAYISPEMARGDRSVDGRADIYSLAAMSYELLTGVPPFPVDPTHPEATLFAHLHRPAPDPATQRPGFPHPVAEVLLWGLRKDPGARPRQATEFAQALVAAIQGRPAPQMPAPAPAPAQPVPQADEADRTRVAPLHGKQPAAPAPPPPPPSAELSRRRRHPALVVTLVALGVLGGVVGIGAVYMTVAGVHLLGR